MTDREKFEAWALDWLLEPHQWARLVRNGGTYDDDPMATAWITWQASLKQALEEVRVICGELEDHYSAFKDTALLNGDVDLSNAASGEPRACRAIAEQIGRLANPEGEQG